MEKPVIFSTQMIQAIIDGRKTQTRRIINPLYKNEPYQPGDILWVRETWAWLPYWNCESEEAGYCSGCTQVYKGEHGCFLYKASMLDWEEGWHPSILMPRKAARIFLMVKAIRAEKLQDISETDAIAEGVNYQWGINHKGEKTIKKVCTTVFAELWDSLNKKRGYGWNTNPWVWVIDFEKLNDI